MASMPRYDVTAYEQALLDQVPEAIATKDPKAILEKLRSLCSAPENADLFSALLILEKYIFRTYEFLYFVADCGLPIAYDEFYFDEECHARILRLAKMTLGEEEAASEFQKGVELVKEKNYEEAGKRFRASALGGNIDGAYNYGITLSNGEGCEADPLEGTFWYWYAACNGHARAMVNLAVAYRTGQGVCADGMCMLYWYAQAGLAGNQSGAQRLADCLIRGEGLQNMEELGRLLIRPASDLSDENNMASFKATVSKLCSFMEPYIYCRNF